MVWSRRREDVRSGSWFIEGHLTVRIPGVPSGASPWPWPVATPTSLPRLTFLTRHCDPRITAPSSQPAYCSVCADGPLDGDARTSWRRPIASAVREDVVADTSEATRSRREQRRIQQQELSRRQLLDAAELVFSDKGYHDATLKEIAEVAEFSVGSVYSFFESKDDLFVSVFLRRGDELLPAMRDIADGSDRPLAKLHALVELEVGFFREHDRFARLFLRTSSATMLSPERAVDEAMRGRFAQAMAVHADVVRQGQKAGEIRLGPPAVLARLLSSLVAGYQASDPAVVGGEAPKGAPMDLAAFHDLVESALRAPRSRR
jgi:AcrR family transcriptional regulator